MPIESRNDVFFMQKALEEAQKAMAIDEVPVGAVIVHKDEIIARAYNLRETVQDATAHAEILAIKRACDFFGTWRLTGCSLYVTLEPCPMCAGASILARLDRIVFGAWDPKTGACGSLLNLPQDERLNHQPEIVPGVLEEPCSNILKSFFKAKRIKNKKV